MDQARSSTQDTDVSLYDVRMAWLRNDVDELRAQLGREPRAALEIAHLSLSVAPGYDKRVSPAMAVVANAWGDPAIRQQVAERAVEIVDYSMKNGGIGGRCDAALRWGITMAYATGDPACVDACADRIAPHDITAATTLMHYGKDDACLFHDLGHTIASRVHDRHPAIYACQMITSKSAELLPCVPPGLLADGVVGAIWSCVGIRNPVDGQHAANKLTGSAYDVAMLGVLASTPDASPPFPFSDLVTTMHCRRALSGPWRDRLSCMALETTMRGVSHPVLNRIMAEHASMA